MIRERGGGLAWQAGTIARAWPSFDSGATATYAVAEERLDRWSGSLALEESRLIM